MGMNRQADHTISGYVSGKTAISNLRASQLLNLLLTSSRTTSQTKDSEEDMMDLLRLWAWNCCMVRRRIRQLIPDDRLSQSILQQMLGWWAASLRVCQAPERSAGFSPTKTHGREPPVASNWMASSRGRGPAESRNMSRSPVLQPS